MPSIRDLPVELLHLIAKEAPCALRTLRAACRHLRMATDPLFFSSEPVVIDLRSCTPGLYGGISYLEALVIGATEWSRYAKTLEIRDIDERRITHPGNLREQIDLFLLPALESLRYLIRKVIWNTRTVDAYNYGTFTASVIQFLNSLAVLNELQLEYREGAAQPTPALPYLSDLSTLKITAPKNPASPLVGLALGVIARSRSLSCLHLRVVRSDWSEVWNVLHEQQIHLSELKTTTGGIDSLLKYLASYSGLMHLFLIDPGREQDQKADRFFNHVLPRHAASLQTLSCGAGYEGRWSFGVHNADAIAGLPNLAILEMSVNLADITNPTISMNRNAVELFIETATQLPTLRALSLVPAASANMRHRVRASRRIREIISAYDYTREVPAVQQWMQAMA
ncbi:hypothetical protein B0H13DRAFT_2275831 [Mycena leptocephala]|nr:hypothetical protein B0H13DRAFT_2275831 [Mycena leptocephala]